jgi:hypothetical protein
MPFGLRNPNCPTAGLFGNRSFMPNIGSVTVEEHMHGETVWVAVRSRGADWSWLKPDEAVELGWSWIEKYGSGAPSEQ